MLDSNLLAIARDATTVTCEILCVAAALHVAALVTPPVDWLACWRWCHANSIVAAALASAFAMPLLCPFPQELKVTPRVRCRYAL
jgi:hypothetical protein